MEKFNYIYFGSNITYKHEGTLKVSIFKGYSSSIVATVLPNTPDSLEFLGLCLLDGISLPPVILLEPRKIVPAPIYVGTRNNGSIVTSLPNHELVFHEIAGNKLLMEWVP